MLEIKYILFTTWQGNHERYFYPSHTVALMTTRGCVVFEHYYSLCLPICTYFRWAHRRTVSYEDENKQTIPLIIWHRSAEERERNTSGRETEKYNDSWKQCAVRFSNQLFVALSCVEWLLPPHWFWTVKHYQHVESECAVGDFVKYPSVITAVPYSATLSLSYLISCNNISFICTSHALYPSLTIIFVSKTQLCLYLIISAHL